ncbi:hypothetical protein BGZ83_006575 [Gryganskiella cystojenkinii]|nr:hypothetical protein BGZ83_006575 [Gryganskiella cystojenkinii]
MATTNGDESLLSAPPTIVVLISGTGFNLQALIDASSTSGLLPANLALVISNRAKAPGLDRARQAGIPTKVHTLSTYRKLDKTRLEYDADLAKLVQEAKPDLILLAGFLHILSPAFLDNFPQSFLSTTSESKQDRDTKRRQITRIINLHPALPGQFDGLRAIERAFEAFQNGEIEKTGVMVHRVIETVDAGEPLLVKEVEIATNDTLESLQQKIHAVEYETLVEATNMMLLEIQADRQAKAELGS